MRVKVPAKAEIYYRRLMKLARYTEDVANTVGNVSVLKICFDKDDSCIWGYPAKTRIVAGRNTGHVSAVSVGVAGRREISASHFKSVSAFHYARTTAGLIPDP